MRGREVLPLWLPFVLLTTALALSPPGVAASAPACGGFVTDATPVPGHSQVLKGVAAVPGTDTAWAVGTFHDNDLFIDRTFVAYWDGDGWTQVRSPSPGKASHDNSFLLGVTALSANDAWAVGYRETTGGNRTLIEHWDGTRWSVVRSRNVATYNELLAVAAVSADDVWAVGHFLNANHDPVRQETLAEHWNGTRWSVVPTPNVNEQDDNELVSVTAIPGTGQAMAVGYHQWDYAKPLVETWDGKRWSVQAAPKAGRHGGYLNDVSAASGQDIWTVGFSIDVYGAYHGLTARWDGAAWGSVPPAPPGGDGYDPMLNGVTTLSTDDAWLVGTYYNGNSALLTLAERWDGSAWRIVSSQDPGGSGAFAANVFNDVAAISATDARAVGYWHLDYNYSDPPHALIESWCP
jgi:hypothetical protein